MSCRQFGNEPLIYVLVLVPLETEIEGEIYTIVLCKKIQSCGVSKKGKGVSFYKIIIIINLIFNFLSQMVSRYCYKKDTQKPERLILKRKCDIAERTNISSVLLANLGRFQFI